MVQFTSQYTTGAITHISSLTTNTWIMLPHQSQSTGGWVSWMIDEHNLSPYVNCFTASSTEIVTDVCCQDSTTLPIYKNESYCRPILTPEVDVTKVYIEASHMVSS